MIYGASLTVAVAVAVTPVGMGAKAHQPRKEVSMYGVIHRYERSIVTMTHQKVQKSKV